jgi:hypothetical protein
MKTAFTRWAPVCGALVLALSLTPDALAQCGGLRLPLVHPSVWHPQNGQARLLRTTLTSTAAKDDEDMDSAPIVGFWHVKFTSKGSGGGIPDGTEVDAGYSQWHSDGTELMNSGSHAPITGNFCMGVWTMVGPHQYQLNHFAIAWDDTGSSLVGPVRLQELITLAPNGQSFSGTFAIDPYVESPTPNEPLTPTIHIQGTIAGSRINVNTSATSIF